MPTAAIPTVAALAQSRSRSGSRYPEAPGHLSDERDAAGIQVEHDRRRDPTRDDDQRPGDLRRDGSQPEEHHQRDRSDEQRGSVGGLEPPDP
jgi:hypothetical protein